MNRRSLLDRLQLDDYLLLDEQVNAKSARQTAPDIDDRVFDLPPAFDTTLQKLMGKACLVRRFQQSGPKRLVNLDCSADHLSGQLFLEQHWKTSQKHLRGSPWPSVFNLLLCHP